MQVSEKLASEILISQLMVRRKDISSHLASPELSLNASMNDPKFQQHGGDHAAEHPPHGPYWKRMHHSPFFWIAVVCIMLAMVIYVTTNNLSVGPGGQPQSPTPALVP